MKFLSHSVFLGMLFFALSSCTQESPRYYSDNYLSAAFPDANYNRVLLSWGDNQNPVFDRMSGRQDTLRGNIQVDTFVTPPIAYLIRNDKILGRYPVEKVGDIDDPYSGYQISMKFSTMDSLLKKDRYDFYFYIKGKSKSEWISMCHPTEMGWDQFQQVLLQSKKGKKILQECEALRARARFSVDSRYSNIYIEINEVLAYKTKLWFASVRGQEAVYFSVDDFERITSES